MNTKHIASITSKNKREHLTRRGDFATSPDQSTALTTKGFAVCRGHFGRLGRSRGGVEKNCAHGKKLRTPPPHPPGVAYAKKAVPP